MKNYQYIRGVRLMAAFSVPHFSESNKKNFERVIIKLFECDLRGTSSVKLKKKTFSYFDRLNFLKNKNNIQKL